MKTRSLLMMFIWALVSVAWATTPEMPDEYLKVYQTGSGIEKEKAAETLAWAGISSRKLFDLVEKEVLSKYPTATKNVPVNYVSWQVRALGFSSNLKYKPTIVKVLSKTPSKKVKKYA